jgi:hypothetical protein
VTSTGAGLEPDIVKSPNLNTAVVVRTKGVLVPVIVNVKLPTTVALQETVALPEPPFIVLGVITLQVKPEGTVSVKATVPVKPFDAPTVMVEMADDPTFTSAGEVEAVVKSWNLNVAVAMRTSGVLLPVIVIV